jgi:hypothetical protein
VFALNLSKRFPSLLDNEVVGVVFHHNFDSGYFVPRHNDKVGEVRSDAIVLSRWKVDRSKARFGRTLAMKRQYLLDTVLLCPFLDPLIDRTKDFLVAGGRIREIHSLIVPHAPSPRAGQLPLRGRRVGSPICLMAQRRTCASPSW